MFQVMRERIENGALLGAFLTVSYCFLVWIKWHNHWECADDSLKWEQKRVVSRCRLPQLILC